jgi:hypothetical protein
MPCGAKMKAYVSENELYPCYGVGLKKDAGDDTVDVPEERILYWRKVMRAFHRVQQEIRDAIFDFQRKQEEIRHLKYCFARENPSRQDKGYILQKFGWTQVDTSVWEKDGRQVRLHEAYNECTQNVQEATDKAV